MGTSQNEDDKVTELSFDALAQAVDSGNTEEIDRLMSEEVPVKEKEDAEEVEDTSEEVNTDEGEEGEDEKEDSSDKDEDGSETPEKKEAANTEKDNAASAAKTATKDKNTTDDRDRELQELRSSAGRVPYLQRRLAELERELRATKARDSNVDKKNTSPAATDLSKIELDPDTQKEIDELKEIDPVMAKTLERVAKMSIANAAHQAASVVTTLTEEEQRAEDARFFMEQKAILSQKIPQHEKIFASPEWKAWKETLSPGRRNLAESGYADEVEQAIYAFAADMQARQASQQRVVEQPAQPAVTEESKQIKEARERKQAGAVDVKSAATKASKVLDENALFTEMYNKIAKENHIL